ncbi:hypothetical protein, partial [Escherichia coli]|uniref:hypothetical protein n=1 Tax=Escherichia coli TaxID=562 RepID=UPI001BC9AC66
SPPDKKCTTTFQRELFSFKEHNKRGMNKNNRTGFIHINLPDITDCKISIYRFTKMQAERPVFATTRAFDVLHHFPGIKNPLDGGL